jgi:gas vesicle protein
MRFIIGLLLGVGIGFGAVLLLAPERGRRGEEEPGEEAAGAGELGEEQDSLAGLRRAMRGLQEQVQEAWEEARQAAQEAEREMRARYQRAIPKGKR